MNGGLAAIIIALLFLGAVIVSLAASFIYRLVSYKHIWYEFGDEEFSFYSGVFNKKRVHVPTSASSRSISAHRFCSACSASAR